jgi:hypothetical protein
MYGSDVSTSKQKLHACMVVVVCIRNGRSQDCVASDSTWSNAVLYSRPPTIYDDDDDDCTAHI